MHRTLQGFADDLTADYRSGNLTKPANDDQLFRDITTELWMGWDFIGTDVVRAYESDHGYPAPSEVEALAWAVAEVFEDFTGGTDVETD